MDVADDQDSPFAAMASRASWLESVKGGSEKRVAHGGQGMKGKGNFRSGGTLK